jgi:hypothetical protein
MSRTILFAALASLAFAATTVSAQDAPSVPSDQRVKTLPRQKLAGPRFGFTTFTGQTADLRQKGNLEPIMSQFGWQFETQIVSMTGGNQALMEWVFLVGGVEQDELNLSMAWMTGYRLDNGLEFGVGPNISVNPRREDAKPTTSMVMAGGVTMPFGDLYVPLNVAVAYAKGGPRITTLLGWIVG